MPKCNHCLLEFPEQEAVYDEIGGRKKVFCCKGCNGIYLLIHDEGLDAFYERRKWDDAGISAALLKKDMDIKPFDGHVRDSGDEKEIDLYIDGIRCASCVWLNEKILGRTKGISYARVNYATHRARIRWAPGVIDLGTILRRVLSIGYIPKPYSESERFRAQRTEARDLLVRFGTAGFLSSQLMIYSIALYAGYFQGIDSGTKLILEVIAMLLTVPVIFYSGMPFIRSMLSGLGHLHFTMDSLIILGAGSAFIYSVYEIFSGGEVYFDTSAMIITLILLGRYIEITAKGRASETVERLSELAPKTAGLVIRDPESGAVVRESVPVSSLKKGDLLEVKPGEKIPLDGKVVEGESEVDESLLTGESRPVLKRPGGAVIGGSMNLYGNLIFEVTKTGGDTVLAGIIRAVEDAQVRKPRIQALADRVVGIFVPAIMITALLTVVLYIAAGASIERSLMTGVSVLVIACPCSLGLATPIAVLMFASMASSRGILVRGGEVIENASSVSRLLFDKTGTITLGKPSLKELVVLDRSCERDYLLALASSVEGLSEHSIGHAVCGAAAPAFPVSRFSALPGRGVQGNADGKDIVIGNSLLMLEKGIDLTALQQLKQELGDPESQGDTVILMGWGRELRALMVISDVIRDEAPEVMHTLKKMNFGLAVVSGDNRATTNAIATRAGIEEALAEASPVGKKDYIAGIQKGGERVMMVGDGINDAPALTEASVGIAMGRGTDIAMESADVILIRNDLRLIPYFIGLSRKTYSVIRQNIFWAFFYNIVAIPLAVAGLLHPIVAAGAMALSSLFVVGNSLRIKKETGGYY